jgi:hypothetical protein
VDAERVILRGRHHRSFRQISVSTSWRLLALLALWLSAQAPACARTITITDLECRRIAFISSEAPRASWAAVQHTLGEFSNFYGELYNTGAMLIQFPLDRIPAGQRITNAELVLPVAYVYPRVEQRFYIRRLIGEWGVGVSHQFRMTRPQKIEWTQAGARGPAADRVARPTAVLRISTAGHHIMNVTPDVELWYGGEVPNQGWILTVDDPNVLIRLNCPSFNGRGLWKLHVTYEPE